MNTLLYIVVTIYKFAWYVFSFFSPPRTVYVFFFRPVFKRQKFEGKKVTVVGDLHGQLFDFDHMLSLAGEDS